MDMYVRMFLPGVLALILSFQADTLSDKKSATELLTQGEWVLKGYGYDENENGVLDPGEDRINDCEKDNTYLFNENGEGELLDNTLICGSGVSEIPFIWKWLDEGEKFLAIGFGQVKVHCLTDNEFVYYQQSSPGVKKFMVILHH